MGFGFSASKKENKLEHGGWHGDWVCTGVYRDFVRESDTFCCIYRYMRVVGNEAVKDSTIVPSAHANIFAIWNSKP